MQPSHTAQKMSWQKASPCEVALYRSETTGMVATWRNTQRVPLSELSRFTSKITPKLAIGHSQGTPSRVPLVVSLIQAKQHPSECLPIQWSCLSSMQHLDLKIDGKTKKNGGMEMGHFGNESRMENGCLQFEKFDRRGRSKFLYPTAEQGCFCCFFARACYVPFLSEYV